MVWWVAGYLHSLKFSFNKKTYYFQKTKQTSKRKTWPHPIITKWSESTWPIVRQTDIIRFLMWYTENTILVTCCRKHKIWVCKKKKIWPISSDTLQNRPERTALCKGSDAPLGAPPHRQDAQTLSLWVCASALLPSEISCFSVCSPIRCAMSLIINSVPIFIAFIFLRNSFFNRHKSHSSFASSR